MPILTETYKQTHLHDEWTAIYRDNSLQQTFNSELLNRVLAHLQLGSEVLFLDAGCGRGDHAVRLVERGYHGVGIDISATVLHRAKERVAAVNCAEKTRLDFVQGCLETLPFPNDSFGFVHCRGVLMHIPDWKAALRELCRVLKPNGSILVMENNDRSIEIKLLRLARAVMKSRSQMKETDGGVEFWSLSSGQPFLARVAKVESVTALIQECGVLPIGVLSGGFVDIGKIPFLWARNLAIEFNRFYSAANLTAGLSSGVAILGHKPGEERRQHACTAKAA
jgi:ubiquinone/menaquinone biosynthesis C-methylase UbiE